MNVYFEYYLEDKHLPKTKDLVCQSGHVAYWWGPTVLPRYNGGFGHSQLIQRIKTDRKVERSIPSPQFRCLAMDNGSSFRKMSHPHLPNGSDFRHMAHPTYPPYKKKKRNRTYAPAHPLKTPTPTFHPSFSFPLIKWGQYVHFLDRFVHNSQTSSFHMKTMSPQSIP